MPEEKWDGRKLKVLNKGGRRGVVWMGPWHEKPEFTSWADVEGLYWHPKDAAAIIRCAKTIPAEVVQVWP